MTASLRVTETFLSIQGEGPSAGERALFLRLAGCNLACQYCDTPYSWDWARFDRAEHQQTVPVQDLLDSLLALGDPTPRLLVVTGGEPLMQQPALAEMLELEHTESNGLRCEVETNGTIPLSAPLRQQITRCVVSPKLDYFAAGSRRSHIDENVLRDFAEHSSDVLKLVLRDEADLPAARSLVERAGFEPHRVWVMPEATSHSQLDSRCAALADAAIAEGWNFTGRLHLSLWGNVPGR